MKLPFYKVIRTEEETEEIAKLIFEELTSNNISTKIIILNGNLGAGKTTFTKSFCKNYKINNVTSPSFSIVNEYIGTKKIYHFDFYRLKKIEELYDIGFEEYLIDEEAIVLIEWGNLMEEILPKNRLEINIEMINDIEREIKIELN
ncbi:MAG: tRNA (adenosine(37)-N6)-threonylcarbamoyltransferase complex ATPase subunit type 1 TsaE [Melioribacteraceae bacterium]|nr:tRNA (adenosine(37)-N6)-threonylcarbamoyltransferase complex ATPase subunit type 1 TsaE [Melioribacteraceae bacterium]